ncbi:RapZ C-terminal domain-containing protein [Streptosporangium subroseum]|uniref:RapZ C-terminal domain-containing protein n=1 Tax=Streptosporangium subroseum TaxID=106412 RepID=UPI00308CACD1|nr:hypothetical protein OHB15_47030 [Streptosporangium subroseum]
MSVASFGYGHAAAPVADLTLDTRRHLRNPHRDPAMRYLTGLDDVVRRHVLDTPGAGNQIKHAVAFVRDLLADLANLPDVADAPPRLVAVAVGCVGGRHRSVALAEAIAAQLHAHGVAVEVSHRDKDKGVIQPTRWGGDR